MAEIWPLPPEASKRSETTSKPGSGSNPGISLGDTRLLPRRCPAYRQHESGVRLSYGTCERVPRNRRRATGGEREGPERQKPRGTEYRRVARGRTLPSSCKPGSSRSVWSQGEGSSR
jgi:hypothetical protein